MEVWGREGEETVYLSFSAFGDTGVSYVAQITFQLDSSDLGISPLTPYTVLTPGPLQESTGRSASVVTAHTFPLGS